ncbi:MAG: hypothetical protein CSB48_08410 [Proteobacteria bacterium]|nr:MAG: hypothetical protein CSB48_08410 [Pseudomonadota bacterium]PIE40287.1 MAG: hypothetical protein CSA51_01450 [Gammaproteobacteria bacterium]
MLKSLHKLFKRKVSVRKIQDNRSGKMVMVIECILNQNARDAGAAECPAMNWPILQLCNEYHTGILALPCPEMKFLGFNRKRKRGQSIRDALDTPEGRDCCGRISVEIADRVEDYIAQGYQILAILGGNPKSPGCAVHCDMDGRLLTASGVFMKELQKELHKRGITPTFMGIRDCDPALLAEDVEQLRKMLSQP